ncbi:MAG: hypothetical protein J0M12_09560 [Deltaproteobacteria bacterium]|nr:hypothetical protein [Deltaproteobacteria bacterium]
MAVTVVRGFVGKTDPDGNSGRQTKNTTNNPTNSHSQSNLGFASARSGEAVISNLHITKVGESGEKLRRLQDAEKLGEEVAARLSSEDEDGTQAHVELSPHSARQHFA